MMGAGSTGTNRSGKRRKQHLPSWCVKPQAWRSCQRLPLPVSLQLPMEGAAGHDPCPIDWSWRPVCRRDVLWGGDEHSSSMIYNTGSQWVLHFRPSIPSCFAFLFFPFYDRNDGSSYNIPTSHYFYRASTLWKKNNT